ncbi:MAG: hypothetical protein IPF92_03930 [Myxococcales bacterium]|nr:hypothetical protein [Myxococcales bacterium]MBL0196589.1 hypothetical protein [Myxococcales bacterium]
MRTSCTPSRRQDRLGSRIEQADGAWNAIPPYGSCGRVTAPDACAAFKRASREDVDEDIVGGDLEFHVPLPPWFAPDE